MFYFYVFYKSYNNIQKSLSIHEISEPWRCMCQFWNKNQLSSDFRNQLTEILEKYLYFYILILKCYHTAIQYLDNVTLSLVVTPKHDKKLIMLGFHFVLRKDISVNWFLSP